MKKIIVGLHISIISISFIFAFWQSPPFLWITFWNAMFALSLLLLLIGASGYIISSGFLTPFIRNFRYFMRRVDRVEQMASEIEKKDSEPTSFAMSSSATKPLIISGGILIILSSFVSIIL